MRTVTHRALVVEEGRTRGALAAVRALHAAGWVVGVGAPGATGLASSSRYVTHRHHVPSPAAGVDDFLSAVSTAVADRGYDVVLAAGDAELLAIAYGADRIAAAVPHPAYDVLLRAVDKLSLGDAAATVGLATPATVLATPETLAAWQGRGVVKPRWHWRPDRPGGTGRCEATIVNGPTQAASAAAVMRSAGAEPLVQEFVEGELMAFACVVDDGGCLAGRVQQRALRIWPARAGVSVRAETVAVDPGLEAKITALLTELGWRGIAELQLLVPAGGEPQLLDLNGRVYGSLALAVGAGLNIPAIAASLAIGRTPPVAEPPRVGTRYHWLEGDLRALRAGGARAALPALVDLVRWGRRSVGGVWDPADRRPAFGQVRDLARRALVRRPR